MKETIFIPKKIKVGFNKREDTYTKKLGYVIYHDGKVWRKEKSWNSWKTDYVDSENYEIKKKAAFDEDVKRQKEYYAGIMLELSKTKPGVGYTWSEQYRGMTEEQYLDKTVGSYKKYKPYLGNISDDPTIVPKEFVNEPLDGFVLNKKAGGYSSGWNHRQTYCRVYDPRGFEFEITIPNLLYILDNATSIKGKGLEGKFIYGWEGKELVLVPEGAPEYKQMVEYTNNLSLKVAKKDLKIGGIYTTDQNRKAVYLCSAPQYNYDSVKLPGKALWFYDMYTKTYSTYTSNNIKKYIEDSDNLSDLLDGLEKDKHYKPKQPKIIKYELILSLPQNYTTVFIAGKTKNSFKAVYFMHRDHYAMFGKPNTSYYLRGSGIEYEEFKTFAELITKYPIYKQIKVDEKI